MIAGPIPSLLKTILFWLCFPALELYALAAEAYSSDSPLQIVTSHLIVVLDQATYDAVMAAPITLELAATEAKTTKAGSDTYTGFYIYGHSTYLEFFGEAGRLNTMSTGDASLGLSSTRIGEIDKLIARLQSQYGVDQITVGHRVKTTGTSDVPWYTYTSFRADTEGVDVWANELDPTYLSSQYPDTHIVDPLSRVEYMAPRYNPSKPFYDVTKLAVDLSKNDSSQFRQFITESGWIIRPTKTGFIGHGPNLVVEATNAHSSRVKQIGFTMNRKVPRRSEHLGHVTLIEDGKSGRFEFNDLRGEIIRK